MIQADSNPINKVFRGDYSLLSTFWLWGVCGQIILGIPKALEAMQGLPSYEMQMTTGVIGLIYKVFICIAICRSADKAEATAKIWRIAAKFVAMLWVPLSIISILALYVSVHP